MPRLRQIIYRMLLNLINTSAITVCDHKRNWVQRIWWDTKEEVVKTYFHCCSCSYENLGRFCGDASKLKYGTTICRNGIVRDAN